jgi:hypothetical protein
VALGDGSTRESSATRAGHGRAAAVGPGLEQQLPVPDFVRIRAAWSALGRSAVPAHERAIEAGPVEGEEQDRGSAATACLSEIAIVEDRPPQHSGMPAPGVIGVDERVEPRRGRSVVRMLGVSHDPPSFGFQRG